MQRFSGKNVLVTGGNSGIGFATAQQFVAEGATVVITGRDKATLDSSLAALGPKALAFQSDSGDLKAQRALTDSLRERNFELDVVFINAGVAKFSELTDVTEDMWDLTFNTNIKGPFFLIQALVPLLRPGCSIVLNGSISAHLGVPTTSVYAASKAALISLCKTISGELIGKGIRVNAISPGPVNTPIYGRLGMSEEQMSEFATNVQSKIPLGRFGTPAEIASAVVYLASTDSAYVVGSEFIVDGGMSQL